MKPTKHILLLAALLLGSITASAHDFAVGGIYYSITSSSDLTVEVTYRGSSSTYYSNEYTGTVTIPESVTYNETTYRVTSIGEDAFYKCSSLTSITIPESVISIGKGAFGSCSRLVDVNIHIASVESWLTNNFASSLVCSYSLFLDGALLSCIEIPSSVDEIPNYAFYNCSSLTSITIPEGVTSIGSHAFYKCSSLTSITIPEGVTSIGSNAFYNCSNLTSITIPEGVTTIGSFAFLSCSGIISVIIPESVTSIGDRAFAFCSSLTSVTLGGHITSIGDEIFYDCAVELIVNCNLPNMSSYDSGAFSGCRFSQITIGDNVTSIGAYAFKNCSCFTPISIPESVVSIGRYAFSGCMGELIVNCNIPSATGFSDAFANSAFTKVTIGENVTSIGYNVFSGCSSLTSIIVEEGNTKYDSREGCNAIINTRIKQLVSGCSTTVIPNGVTSIGVRAFDSCTGLTSIIIPESVTSIENYAFSNCNGLASIIIPEGVTSIGDDAFSDCSNLTSVIILEGVTSIGNNVFKNCSSLTTITIPESVAKIGWYVFDKCTSLTSVIFPEETKLTSIPNYTFRNCSNLTTISIPESVASIGEYAFAYCSSLTPIIIPQGVIKIGAYAFYRCPGELIVNCNIPSESPGAFCSSEFSKVTIGSNVTSIGSRAFYDCRNLTSITIPESVTSIGGLAFSGCSSLTSVVLPNSLQTINSEAFANCTELANVYCHAEVVPSASSNAFSNSYPEYSTLHVPVSALESYKTTAPWSSFGTIAPLKTVVTEITLSQSSATLPKGESLALTATVSPDDAYDKTVTWSSSDENVAIVDAEGKVTAIALGTATITATANDGSGVTASCEVEVRARPVEQCAIPMIDYIDGQVVLTCATEGVTFVSETTASGIAQRQVATFDLAAVYTITAYATKEGYLDSETVTAVLCWIECIEEHEAPSDPNNPDTGITIPSRPVLIQSSHGVITLTGLAEGTKVRVCNLAGVEVAHAVAEGGKVALSTNLAVGSTVIVYVGELRSVKVIVR